MNQYKLYNNILGWVTFAIALAVYLLTLEPTVSLWDCGEFTSAAYKLEVGHPPGAPFYLMLGRIFSLFSPDKSQVGMFINSLSAIASAFTVLFLFWTITHLARRIIIQENNNYSQGNIIAILASGFIGALAFCFSDTFWFSAVEAEVYALSSLFTAIVIWAILKWEDEAGQKFANRWLILISYLMGISIGVHLLNLLAIPAIVLIYYFKMYPFSWKRFGFAVFVSFLILLGVMNLIIPGIVWLASRFEIVFSNYFGFANHVGAIIYLFLLIGLLIWGLNITYRHKKFFWNSFLLVFTVILIGYCSYAMIIIRAQTQIPINTNQPKNVLSLLYYLNRDQYGDSPLIYGQYYNSPTRGVKDKAPVYTVKDGKYVASSKRQYIYDERFMTIFPRMYSSKPGHVEVYKDWGTIKGTPVRVANQNGGSEIVMKPTFGDNLEFFFKYQLGYMYFRYFMWNFVGRQNDLQGNGGILKGNWISGIDFIDKFFIGPQNTLPQFFRNNVGKNRYYFLPLILGFIGLLYQASKSRRYFVAVLFIFILTGIAIVLYTNQTPQQPRERDYAYVGSFYAFCIWIGLGVLALSIWLKRILKPVMASIAAGMIALVVPVILLGQNWNDHDRSNRFIVRDLAFNYLNSCAPNSILFTVGDNDTYPLWYLQEVEGIRTDVRVVNLMLLNASWYIDQMRNTQYTSEKLPISFQPEQYVSGKREAVYILEKSANPITLKNAINIIASDSKNYKIETASGAYLDFIPSKKLLLPVNKEEIVLNSTILPSSIDMIEDTIKFNLPSDNIGKSELIVMDILSNFDWKRPVYFNSPGYKWTLGLDNYLQLDGFAYKLMPVYSDGADYLSYGNVEIDSLYKKLMFTFKWRGLSDPSVLLDEHIVKTLSIIRVRNCYARLALALAAQGNFKKGIKVLDRCMEIMPTSRIPYDVYCIQLSNAYYKCGDQDKGNKLAEGYANQLNEELSYYNSLSPKMQGWINLEKTIAQNNLKRLQTMLNENTTNLKL